jgi:ADP-ribose pyrophosphatase YjhB (NUDIX family)
MGSGAYDSSVYRDRVDTAKSTGSDVFGYTDDIKHGRAVAHVHEKLDPSKPNKAGNLIRESFDSVEHPTSNSIAVLFDVTGSMHRVPRLFMEALGTLMATLTKKGYVNDPAILFGAIGDATTDSSPLQLGQFEAGNQMDECLTNIHLEGGGGGQNTESYELAMYYMARHTNLDCVTKRTKKGYLFITGDERPYPMVKKSEVARFIGDTLQENIPIKDILTELRQKYEVFWVMPGGTGHWGDSSVEDYLRELFEQNFIKLENPANIVELIATTIGVCEGHDINEVSADLVAAGSSETRVTAAASAVADLVAARNLSGTGTDKIARL